MNSIERIQQKEANFEFMASYDVYCMWFHTNPSN